MVADMDEARIVTLIGLLGWLILVGCGYRSYRVAGRKTLVMAAAWIGIFAVAMAVFASMG